MKGGSEIYQKSKDDARQLGGRRRTRESASWNSFAHTIRSPKHRLSKWKLFSISYLDH